MIQKLLLNTQMMRMVFLKVLKNTDQIKNGKYWLYLMTRLLVYLVIKNLIPIVTELFIRGKKLNICFIFMTQSYFTVLKNIKLNSTHYFVIKIPTLTSCI